jgi:hypothetical protein
VYDKAPPSLADAAAVIDISLPTAILEFDGETVTVGATAFDRVTPETRVDKALLV